LGARVLESSHLRAWQWHPHWGNALLISGRVGLQWSPSLDPTTGACGQGMRPL